MTGKQYLEICLKNGVKRGFEHMEKVLSNLKSPQEKVKTIHVAGTNGKGSVCAMLSSVLEEEGYRTGFFSSPHLESYNERFRINGKPVSDEDLNDGLLAVKAASEAEFGNDFNMSHFQVLVCACFYIFHRKNVDFLLLETGVGGTYDATNVIKNPLLAIITSIGLDHTAVLGNSVFEIASHKAGIIKKNLPAVLYFSSKEVYNVVKSKCDETGAKLYNFDNLKINVLSSDLEKTEFSISSDYFEYERIKLKMLGTYQLSNVATALLAVEALKERIKISKSSVLNGLFKASWAGRMEVLKKNPPFILDGAHNADGMSLTMQTIEELFPEKDVTVVAGFLKEKNFEEMLGIIMRTAKTLILTKPSYGLRALEPSVILERGLLDGISKNQKLIVEQDCNRAVDLAVGLGAPVIVTGSLYLVGDVRTYFFGTLL